SSDVCSSDLLGGGGEHTVEVEQHAVGAAQVGEQIGHGTSKGERAPSSLMRSGGNRSGSGALAASARVADPGCSHHGTRTSPSPIAGRASGRGGQIALSVRSEEHTS